MDTATIILAIKNAEDQSFILQMLDLAIYQEFMGIA